MSLPPTQLETRILELAALPAGTPTPEDAVAVIESLLAALESGTLRSATRDASGRWHAVPWVKRGILVGFRYGTMVDLSPSTGVFSFVAKSTIPPQHFDVQHGVRIVPGGSTIRRGAHVASGVVCMPPMFRHGPRRPCVRSRRPPGGRPSGDAHRRGGGGRWCAGPCEREPGDHRG